MRLSWLRAQVGGTTVSALALTLLVLGCVFVAVAGPRYSLHSRTRALQHELTAVTPVDRAVQVTDDWYTFANIVSPSTPPALDDSQLGESPPDRPFPGRDAAAARPGTVGGPVDQPADRALRRGAPRDIRRGPA